MKKLLTLLLALAMLFTLAACTTAKAPAPTPTPTPEPTSTPEPTPIPTPEPVVADDRGIPGMDPFAVLSVLDTSFGLPLGIEKPANEYTQEYCAYSRTNNSEPNSDGISYDYSISLDNDHEIVGATFGISTFTASQITLLQAADLYFHVISLMEYDTADTEALSAWIKENLETVANTEGGVTTTIGDAVFSFYGMKESTYWLDIAKATD